MGGLWMRGAFFVLKHKTVYLNPIMELNFNHSVSKKLIKTAEMGFIGHAGFGFEGSKAKLILAHSGLPNSCGSAENASIEMEIKALEQKISGFAEMCTQTKLSFVFLDEALMRLSKSRRKNEIGIYPALNRGKKNRKPKLRMLLPCFGR